MSLLILSGHAICRWKTSRKILKLSLYVYMHVCLCIEYCSNGNSCLEYKIMTAGWLVLRVTDNRHRATRRSKQQFRNCKRFNLPPTMAIALLLPDYLPVPFANMNAGTSSAPSFAAMDFDLRRNDLELHQNGQQTPGAAVLTVTVPE